MIDKAALTVVLSGTDSPVIIVSLLNKFLFHLAMDLWINRYLIVLIILCNQIMNLLIYNILQLFL